MKRGVPPTALKARTGLLTPPTRVFSARSYRILEFLTFKISHWANRAGLESLASSSEHK